MCLTFVSIPQEKKPLLFTFFNKKQEEKKDSALHCIHKYRSLNTLKGFWASVREWCYNTKLGPSLSS